MRVSMGRETIGELLAYSIENSVSGIVVTDLKGIITYVNSRQCLSSGYDREELVGRNARMFQSGKTPPEVYRELWATILSGESWQGELLNRRKNGDLCWEHIYISPVTNGEDGVVAFWAIKEEHFHRKIPAQQTHNISLMDPLTGLLNKNAFLLNVDKIIHQTRQQQEEKAVTVYYVDIDRFHTINQNLGYRMADTVLVETARRLKGCFRQSDMVARIGADVFAILLSKREKNSEDEKTLQRLIGEIRRAFTVRDQQIFVTASIGSACFPQGGDKAEDVLESARQAMKKVRSEGGDGYHILTGSPETDEMDGNLANDLRHAIERNQLELYYQPQVNVISGETVGLEALLRWFKSDGEMVPPGIFIPIAEKSELIVSIGEWVLRQAVMQVASWRQQGLPYTKVAVNLSAKHFHRSDLVPYIKKLLDEIELEPHFLELELTEGAVLQDPVKVKENIAELKSLGVHISLDDFGTGHSSLVWLSQLPVDQVKIDKSFITDVTVNPVNASIVSATIAMAEKLDKDSIAEGVETEAQLRFLRGQGCDFVQGFLFSKPLPADQIALLLSQKRTWPLIDLTSALDRCTILVVDDDPQIVRMLKRVFRDGQYRVLSAHSGKEALEILALNPVQIIISDHLMPMMTGVELLTTIKKMYPNTIRIILSGQADVSTIIDAINEGAIWKYFTKPVETEILKKTVRKACQRVYASSI